MVTYFVAEVTGNVVLQVEEVVDFKWVPLVSSSAHLSFSEARRLSRYAYSLVERDPKQKV